MTTRIQGGCHCGKVGLNLVWPGSIRMLPARRCGCGFCRRVDGTWTSHPDASLDLRYNRPEAVTAYRFGTGTADFLFCRACGIPFAVTCRIDGKLLAVVNVHALRLEDQEGRALELQVRDMDFEAEQLEQRLSRRKMHWIGTVRVF